MALTYILLLLLRTFLAFAPGYIHPDEFFQSSEPMAGFAFDGTVDLPWEWKTESPGPSRHVLVPSSLLAAPFYLFKLTKYNPSGISLFIIQRIVMLLLSFVVDICLYILTRTEPDLLSGHRCISTAMYIHASSVVTLAFLVRPFSNSWVAILVALGVTLVARKGVTVSSSFWVAVVAALTVFTRTDGVAFFLPLGFIVFGLLFQRSSKVNPIVALVVAITGFAIVAATTIFSDSIYYGSLLVVVTLPSEFASLIPEAPWLSVRFGSPAVEFLPRSGGNIWTNVLLNNARYNADVRNLAEHGLHPWWLHAAVNLNLLWGGAAWWGILGALRVWGKARIDKKESEDEEIQRIIRLQSSIAMISPLSVVVTSTVILSIAPHQEPRFLVPLAMPVALLASQGFRSLKKFKTLVWGFWILFNAATTLFFGVVHQAGVIGVLKAIGESEKSPFVPLLGVEVEAPPMYVPDANSGNKWLDCIEGEGGYVGCRWNRVSEGVKCDRRIKTTVVVTRMFRVPWHLGGMQWLTKGARCSEVEFVDVGGADVGKVAKALQLGRNNRPCKASTSNVDFSFMKRDGFLHRTVIFSPTHFVSTLKAAIEPYNASLVPLAEARPPWVWHVDADRLGDVVGDVAMAVENGHKNAWDGIRDGFGAAVLEVVECLN
ncbi:alpha 1,2 mannosyltransferase [Phlyctochytrium planicorne]|nr:alpha 1,2 mannosyltransferase [Phlyctochytrium planicorne]